MNELGFSDTELRWHAILTRAHEADSRFVYAVRTTGIYCRPSCPSRRPKRANVEFFETWRNAQEAGYRACKRCTPDQNSRRERQLAAVEQACILIKTADELPALKELAGAVGISPYHFHRLFKQLLGVTPKEYAATHRVNRLQQSLEEGVSVSQAIYDAGYGSSSRVYENAKDTLGMTPAKFRSGAEGLCIRYVITDCPLGWLLVAATNKGVCTIAFDDDPDELLGCLKRRFKHAELREDRAELHRWVDAVIAFLKAPNHDLELPLDIQGTAFQRRVWKALQDIHAGNTASYGAVATAIGKPKAVRAVAQACASNPVPLVIPCHRVVRANGELSGYRWGIKRKSWLLHKESQTPSATRSEDAEGERAMRIPIGPDVAV